MSRFERWSVWITSLLTAITGAGLLWTKYFIQASDPWAVVNSPLQPWFLRTHLIVSPLLVFAIGLITTRHIWRHYRTSIRLGRRSGVTIGVAIFPMIVSGYLIQVLTGRGWLAAMVIVHIATGLAYAAGLALHQVAIRSRRPLPAAPGSAGQATGLRETTGVS